MLFRSGDDDEGELVGPDVGDEVGDIVGEAVGEIVGESVRSEERRVGKECRSRRSPYH